MDDRSRSRRRLVLFLIAVITPGAAIIGLGVRLMMQEGRFEASRRAESFEVALRDFALELGALRDAPQEALFVLEVPVDNGRLAPSWRAARGAELSGPFGGFIRDGETNEFARGRPGLAADDYAQAEAVAGNPDQRALARLSRMRAARRAGRAAEADSAQARLAATAPGVTDEFGVPMALYAVSAMTSAEAQLQALVEHTAGAPTTSPQAAFLYRAIRDTLRARIETPARLGPLDAYVDGSLAAVRLQDDFASLAPLLEKSWLLFANDRWLLTTANDTLRVLDASGAVRHAAATARLALRGFEDPVLTSTPDASARFLGPRFTDVYARMEPVESADDAAVLQRVFIGLVALLVVALLSVGVVLIWRDARRDLETARLRSDFVSNVSHELKTPLTAIRMYAETLRLRRHDTDLHDDYLDTIVSESSRLTRLLDNVLDFARIEQGAHRYSTQPVVLQHVVERGLDALDNAIREGGFRVDTDLPPDAVRVQADPDALDQVILNLLSNAIKYSGDSRDIRVSVTRNGGEAHLSIEDDGIGIAAADLPHVFDPYWRVPRDGGPKIPGTGLGLSIVKHTVEAHGGIVAIESEPGHGSRFTVMLPLA